MRTFKRFQTVYKKLISSYIIVIFLTVIMVAVIMHSYSSRLLRDEMINFGSEVIARISETLDKQVFNRVERLWLECAVSDNKLSSAITNSGTLKHYDYYDIFTELTRHNRYRYVYRRKKGAYFVVRQRQCQIYRIRAGVRA